MNANHNEFRKRSADRPGLVRWGAHVMFWLAYFVMRTSAATADPPEDVADFPYLANRALAVFSYFLLTGILLAAIGGPNARRSTRNRNLALIVGALALAPLTQFSESLWPRVLGGAADPYPLVIYLFQFGWVLMLWGLMQAVLGYHFATLEQARAVGRAQALAYDAQVRMLHYQINPHFLFNTLNAISSLVLDNRNAQAETMLLRLAGFLRYSLDRQHTELAKLSDEIEAQRKYLEIERTRFDEKLEVRFDIEPGLENVRVPSLILQPILENAIKYAISPNPNGGRIDVSARRDDGLLRIRVEDSGPGFPAEGERRGRAGVGLANARERLELMFGEAAGLSTSNRKPNGSCVELWLPMEKEFVRRNLASVAG